MADSLWRTLQQHRTVLALGIAAFVLVVGHYIISEPLEGSTAQTFKISSTRQSGPVFHFATVDPSDVKVGDTQRFAVHVTDQIGIVAVSAITKLDTQVREITLKPVSGEEYCTDCVWEGSWKVNDTSDKTYETKIVATNNLGRKKATTISWTDPCSPPVSGSWTLDGNCQISITDGLEEGTFTIPEDKTLTILNGGVWVYQEGHPINIQGTIAIQEGGKLSRSLLWAPDSDSDGYAPSTSAQVASLTQPGAEYVRRKTLTGFGDCYDSNASAHPAQTSYFTSHRGDGSFDYNCSGGEDKYYPYQSTGTCYSCDKYGCSGVQGWSSGGSPSCGETRAYYTNNQCSLENRTQSCR